MVWRWIVTLLLLVASFVCFSAVGSSLFTIDTYHMMENPTYAKAEYEKWLNIYGAAMAITFVGFAVSLTMTIRRYRRLRRGGR